MSEELQVLLADDDEIYRENLAQLLNEVEGVHVVATATDGAQALSELAKHLVDVALLDVDMPVLDGITTAGVMMRTNPSVKVVILTAFKQEESLSRSLEENVAGFLTKDIPVEQLAQMLRQAHQGSLVLGNKPTELLTKNYLSNQRKQQQYQEFRKRVDALPAHLKPVLELVTQALSNKEIARKLSLSESTIKSYVSDILTYTECNTRGQLTLNAVKAGLV